MPHFAVSIKRGKTELPMTETRNLINTLRQTSVPISSKLVGRVVAELERLQARVESVQSMLSTKVVELRGCYALCVEKDEKAARESAALQQIRDVCALPAAPLAELPALIENLLSELADRQIRSDIAAHELEVSGDGSGEELPPVADMPRTAAGIVVEMDPENATWK